MKVVFEELPHDYYTIHTDGSKMYGLSMTTFIGRFKKPFLKRFWKIYKAVQHQLQIKDKKDFSAFCNERGCGFKQYKDITDEDERIAFFKSKMEKYVRWNNVVESTSIIQEAWDTKKDNACEVGTAFHEYKEREAFNNKVETIGDREVKLAEDELEISAKTIKFSKELKNLKDGYHPEVLLYTTYIEIEGIKYNVFLVGQVDKVFIETINGIRYVDIDDYKTNEEISLSNKYDNMLFPVDNLEDCDLNHYSLQVVGYGEILRQHGFVPRNLYVTHHGIKELGMTKELNENIGKEKVKKIKAKNLREEFNSMIKHSFPAEIQYKRNYVTQKEKKELIPTAKSPFFDYD